MGIQDIMNRNKKTETGNRAKVGTPDKPPGKAPKVKINRYKNKPGLFG